ncbi:MAG: hypothetical protein KatS3mg105_5142 [Gemmatales bacterium]|nr:MAG: hypothetical protein KatS3mg105_5142 [Gemmatales bacterium]GIW97847.1 MAG: hypothetical protein KatS3mg111_1180 [Pirellulaceae bacterium]
MKLFRRMFTSPERQGEFIPQIRVRTAHLVGPGSLSVRKGRLHFENAANRKLQLDAEELDEIVAYGDVQVSAAALYALSELRIHLTWLSPQGTMILGRLVHDGARRTLTRLLQTKAWEDRSWQVVVARKVVRSKIESMISALRHYQRQGYRLTKGVLRDLADRAETVKNTSEMDALRGIEGSATAVWFQEWGALFRDPWHFPGRNRRPPRDPVNALLSFGYTFVYRRVAARIEAAGFEPNLGALHEFRPGRAGMACDLMEPLRIPVVDRWVLAICNQGRLAPSDFDESGDGVYLQRERLPHVASWLEQHWHQGNFDLVVEELIREWARSTEESVTYQTSRAASYLHKRWVRAALAQARERDDE